jgi:hypothetical protein
MINMDGQDNRLLWVCGRPRPISTTDPDGEPENRNGQPLPTAMGQSPRSARRKSPGPRMRAPAPSCGGGLYDRRRSRGSRVEGRGSRVEGRESRVDGQILHSPIGHRLSTAASPDVQPQFVHPAGFGLPAGVLCFVVPQTSLVVPLTRAVLFVGLPNGMVARSAPHHPHLYPYLYHHPQLHPPPLHLLATRQTGGGRRTMGDED